MRGGFLKWEKVVGAAEEGQRKKLDFFSFSSVMLTIGTVVALAVAADPIARTLDQ